MEWQSLHLVFLSTPMDQTLNYNNVVIEIVAFSRVLLNL